MTTQVEDILESKTLRKTRERFYWDRLRADIEKWRRESQACGARKGPKIEQGKSVTERTPAEIFYDRILRSSPTNSEARLKSVQASAGEKVKLSRKRTKTRYNFKATDHHFKDGNLVWMYNPKRRRGLSPSYNRTGKDRILLSRN
ncbi:hypothetical protein AVEN_162944-1 [Araneus ventricosus]|uniref:Integrase zinc-binding domain-containing protein n=1 Tax=Araneus ventricosus TaxID=182803 RepID=A0A4Y2BZA4_ARAVE|nr:hypothetical protein AVEN_162944-1 [Araneus ventricosus]